jgi:hypothetical protein
MFAVIRTAFSCSALLGLALAATIALADPPKDPKSAQPAPGKPAEQPEFKLPPGWTAADMLAFAAAATPGEMHKHLLADAGVWNGKNTMWMAPGADPIQSESTSTITPLLGGRFIRCEVKGEMPGMGPYHGLGVYGYDNIEKKFIATWIDNHSTSMGRGTGELSKDGKTLTWTFTSNCPITKKPATMRQVETVTGEGTKTLEMFGAEPKSGVEFKMMRIELTKAKQ